MALYKRIVAALKEAGHRVLAGAVASEEISAAGEAVDRAAIFARDVAWMNEAAAAGGALVAEVSIPSVGVGYEIAYARHGNPMRVICLWRPAYSPRCSAMIAGDPGVELLEYRDETTGRMIEELLVRLRE